MKVFVVTTDYFDGGHAIGVYMNEQQAEKGIKKFLEDYRLEIVESHFRYYTIYDETGYYNLYIEQSEMSV